MPEAILGTVCLYLAEKVPHRPSKAVFGLAGLALTADGTLKAINGVRYITRRS